MQTILLSICIIITIHVQTLYIPGSVKCGGCMHGFWYGGATHYNSTWLVSYVAITTPRDDMDVSSPLRQSYSILNYKYTS